MPESELSGKIALCLSGGGLRATLFHLGLVKALRHHSRSGQSALEAVSEIYSVSGGSITAAHVVRNWPKYTGTDDQFAAAEKQLLNFAARNIRDRVVRRWLLTRLFGKRRTYWLQKEYEHLLGRQNLGHCYGKGTEPPTLHILATSFRTGELCSFSRNTFELVKRTQKGASTVSTNVDRVPMAFAVAASSAFPPLFPPVALTPYMLGEPDGEDFDTTLHLSDGGVYDNFGIDKFRLIATDRTANPGTLIISHAGGSFRADQSRTYGGAFSRNIRASDIMMRRVGENTEASAASIPNVKAILVRIGDTVENSTVKVVTQRRLRLVRTDLDRFDGELGKLLVDHGYRVGAAALSSRGWQGPEPAAEHALDDDGDRLDHVAGRASKRSFWSLIFDFRDWATTPLLWALALLAATGVSFFIIEAFKARAAEKAANTQLAERATDQADRLQRMKTAFAAGRLDVLERELGVAIRATEQLAANPELDTSDTTQQITAAQARAIVFEQPKIQVPVATARNAQAVYIHFAGGNLTRAKITALNKALKDSGWNTQGASGERVPAAIGLNQVRYSGENKDAATALATAINAAGITSQPVEAKPFRGIGKNTLEVWISN